MFRPEDVQEHLRRRPFVPFRVTLTDGRRYRVRHPELAMVGRSSVVIGIPRPRERRAVYDRTVIVSLLHVREIEPAATAGPEAGPEGEN